jgi:phosphoribosylaminoimidazole-succinocarboxamide synthase
VAQVVAEALGRGEASAMMNPADAVRAQLAWTLQGTDFSGAGELYRGKVRDVYRQADRLVMVTTDRVSAFDHVLGTIPFKGQILNAMALDAFQATADILPNHLLDVPDPNVVVAKVCHAYPVELIVRGYITGSLWRDYLAGTAGAYGVPLPEGLVRDQAFEAPHPHPPPPRPRWGPTTSPSPARRSWLEAS